LGTFGEPSPTTMPSPNLKKDFYVGWVDALVGRVWSKTQEMRWVLLRLTQPTKKWRRYCNHKPSFFY